MKQRQHDIIAILKEKNGWVTGKELSAILDCSDRTIRNDMNEIEAEMEGCIESSFRYGYRLTEKYHHADEQKKNDGLPTTSHERCIYITKKLFNQQRVGLYELENEIYYSAFTIRSDIKVIQKQLETYDDLELIESGNYFSLSGSEEAKRRLYKKLLTSETKGDFININKIDELFPELDLIKIQLILKDVLEENDYKVREEAYPMLIIHIGVALQRMKDYKFVETPSDTKELESTVEYHIADEFYGVVTKLLNIEANKNETLLLASLLMGKKHTLFVKDKNLLIESKTLTEKIMYAIKEQYDIDFSKDEYFSEGMSLHIQNLIGRLNRNTIVSNVYLPEIKKSYPLVFEMSVFVGRIIKNYLNKEVNEDELGYLAIHIGAAYDRINVRHFYHVVLIHPNNKSMLNLCSQKITDRFGNRIVIDMIENFFDVNTIKKLNPDFIISTVHITHTLSTPTVFISMFMNSDDEYKIFKLINELDRNRHKKGFDKMIQQLLNEDYYFYNLQAKTYEEVISTMCDKLYQGGRVDKDFKESTYAREKMAYTSFNYGYAIPHSLDYHTIKSTISIAILKKPIMWGNYQVKFVMLLAIEKNDKDILKVFFDWFSNICDDSVLLANIMKAKTAKELREIIVA